MRRPGRLVPSRFENGDPPRAKYAQALTSRRCAACSCGIEPARQLTRFEAWRQRKNIFWHVLVLFASMPPLVFFSLTWALIAAMEVDVSLTFVSASLMQMLVPLSSAGLGFLTLYPVYSRKTKQSGLSNTSSSARPLCPQLFSKNLTHLSTSLSSSHPSYIHTHHSSQSIRRVTSSGPSSSSVHLRIRNKKISIHHAYPPTHRLHLASSTQTSPRNGSSLAILGAALEHAVRIILVAFPPVASADAKLGGGLVIRINGLLPRSHERARSQSHIRPPGIAAQCPWLHSYPLSPTRTSRWVLSLRHAHRTSRNTTSARDRRAGTYRRSRCCGGTSSKASRSRSRSYASQPPILSFTESEPCFSRLVGAERSIPVGAGGEKRQCGRRSVHPAQVGEGRGETSSEVFENSDGMSVLPYEEDQVR